MGGFWSPTTKAQVSGHRFLKRRVEHGLLFGDIRMIHDPLAARSRAMLLGCVAVILGMLAAGLFAWMSPQPDPGDSPIVRAEDGQLYVRIEQRLHPVANLTSARLIAGMPAEPENIGSDFLSHLEQGIPVGIHPAPGEITGQGKGAWGVCVDKQNRMVVQAGTVPEMAENSFLAVHAAGRDWVITVEGRHEMPDGRGFQRALGTPQVREVPDAWLNAVPEADRWQLPHPLPEIVEDSWAIFGDSATPITPVQAAILLDAGAATSALSRSEAASLVDGPTLTLPETELTEASEAEYVCAGEKAVGQRGHVPNMVELSGDSPASAVSGLAGDAVVVNTGRGFQVISPHGLRHELPTESVEALGINGQEVAQANWEIISLLPPGPVLSADEARKSVY